MRINSWSADSCHGIPARKVGPLPENLPAADEQITTEVGDLILCQGKSFVIYYAPNTWSFTRLGKIDDITADELKAALGCSDVAVDVP